MFEWFKKKERAFIVPPELEGGFSRPTSSGQHVTEASALALPAVFACVRVLSESIGALPLVVYERQPDGTKQRARGHNLYNILHDSPNPFMDSISFWELMTAHCALRGNAFARVERDEAGEVTALWPLLPQNMNVKIDDNGQLVYEYHSTNGFTELFQWFDILHIKGLTFDGVTGLSPLTLLRDTIGRAQAINEYSGKYFHNDARPGGILRHPGKISQQGAASLKSSWNAAFKGSGNSHKVALLEEGMEFTTVGLSPEDSQMIDSQKFSVVDIARVFRVPLNLIQDHERSTYSNVTEQNRSFVVHALMPWLVRIEQACNRILFTESERLRFYTEHKLDSLLRGDQETRYKCYQIGLQEGFLSKNDVRGYENLSPVQGGDDYKTG
ncbi:MAG: phage portal protein [Desulfamplus sp.]|nr:phage portal protein [Desulfamplus sp.]